MAKRQLNKNVIVGLTVGGMVVVIGAVAATAYSASQRDPAIYAKRASDAEKVGDWKRAAEQYKRAFNRDKNAVYLTEAARCEYKRAEFGACMNLLRYAHAQSPQDPKVLTAMLEHYWEMQSMGIPLPESMLRDIRDYAEKLVKIEPDNMVGLIWLADSIDSLERMEKLGKGDERTSSLEVGENALKHAEKLEPGNPRVALVQTKSYIRKEAAKLPPMGTGSAAEDAQKAKFKEILKGAAAILQPANKGNKTEPQLATMLAELYHRTEQEDEAIRSLQQAAEDMPDKDIVQYWLAQSLLRAASPKELPKDKKIEMFDQAIEHANRAVAVEPAMYAAYILKAEALRLKYIEQGRWDSERAELQREVLDLFVNALAATAVPTTLRGKLSNDQRAQMVGRATDLAMVSYQDAPDEPTRAKALEYVRQFQTEAQNQFKDWVYRYVIDGRVAQIDNDATAAIKAYKRAEELVGGDAELARVIKEQLMGLYLNASPGLALRYADETLVLYQQKEIDPSPYLCWQRAWLLFTLDRKSDAISFLEELRRKEKYKNDTDLRNLLARITASEGKVDEARGFLVGADKDDVLALMEEARIAANAGTEKREADNAGGAAAEFDVAEAKLSKALSLQPSNPRVIQLYVQMMTQADRRTQCAEKLQEISGKTDPALKLMIEAYRVALTETDQAARDAALLKIIEQTPDACDRSNELVTYWWARKDWEKVAKHLAELAKCRGENSPEVLVSQFNLALRTKKFDEAEKVVSRIATANLDKAGGSTFRGELKVARVDLAGALGEFRNAERELPGDAGVKLKVAEVLLRHSPPRVQDAVQALRQAHEYNPRNFDVNRLLFACYDELGDREEALKFLKKASAINKNDPFVKERMRLVDEEGDPNKGIPWRLERRKEKPDDMSNLTRLVELYEKIGKRDEAEQVLKEALAAVEKPTLPLATLTARFFATGKRRTEGEEFLRKYIAGCEGVDKLDGMLLLGRFYEFLENTGEAIIAYNDCEARIDELAGKDAELRRRAKTIVAAARADFYGRMKEYAQMAEEYRIAIANLPADLASQAGDYRVKRVKALLANGQTEEAGKEIESFQNNYGKDVRGLQLKAEWLLRSSVTDKSMDDARDLLNKVLAEQPNNTFALYLRGKVGKLQRHYDEARADLLKCKAVDATAFAFAPRLELAAMYEVTGQPALAEQELREIVKESKDDEKPKEPGEELELGKKLKELLNFFDRTEQHAKSQALVSEQMARAPEEPLWHHLLGLLMAKRGQPETAVTELKKAVDLSKGHKHEAEFVADWLRVLRDSGRAKDVVAAIPQLNPSGVDAKVLRVGAEAYLKLGMRPQALQQFEKALELAAGLTVDDAGDVVDNIMRTMSVDDAIASIRKLITTAAANAPTQLRLRLVLARALIMGTDAQRRTDGLKLADEVLAQAPPRTKLAVTALLVRALGQETSGDSTGAVKTYEQALAIDPGKVQALNNIAYLLADRLKKPKEALPYAERAAQVMPGNSDVQDTVGWIYHMLGSEGQAETSLLESVRLNPSNIAALYHLGKVYETLGRMADARKMYERVMERCKLERNSPYCVEAQEALNKLK